MDNNNGRGGGGRGRGGKGQKRRRRGGGRGRGGKGGGDAPPKPPRKQQNTDGRPKPHAAPPAPPAPHASARTSSTTRAHLTGVAFATLQGVVSPNTLRAIDEVLGYPTMTQVQQQALPVCARGGDVVAKAKTGTGKTLAFMVPSVDRAAASKPHRRGLSALVLSPTRELAAQTVEEGKLLATFHGLRVACVFGGTKIQKDYNELGLRGGRAPDILVATPGRLNDHLENTQGVAPGICDSLETLVFDEADQLLDMGFRPAIEKILRAIESTKLTRQTLLFSATMPDDVASIARLAMKSPQYHFVDTVGEEQQTHVNVPQRATICETQKGCAAELIAVLNDACSDPEHKVIAFFTTARLTQFYAELCLELAKDPTCAFLRHTKILEIHSRKSQSHRTKVSDIFRNSVGKACLLTSDVTARGMDYPDVTRVIQVGLPSDAAQYVHRLGRTARAGKQGSGDLILCRTEAFFLNDAKIRALPLQQLVQGSPTVQLETALYEAARRLPPETTGASYQAWLGFYNSFLRRLRWDKERLVEEANVFAEEVLALPGPPPLQAKTVGKMGLKGVRGLNVLKGPPGNPPGSGRGRGGGGGKGRRW
mmetsp:Transcript_16580/g.48468  ORF Transcript_16580/g.48468 Transcript_16580/m.48468 type:complete len:594 (+) Transcript_16580:191-1972(+)